jgi:hypothetical protein
VGKENVVIGKQMKECTKIKRELDKLNPDFLNGVICIRQHLKSRSRANIWQKNDLCGACAISAYLVFELAKHCGLKAVFVHGSGHCYTLVECFVVDVTYAQFNYFESFVKDTEDFVNSNQILLAKDIQSFSKHSLKRYLPVYFLKTSKSILKKTKSWHGESPLWFLYWVDEKWIKSLNVKLGFSLVNQNEIKNYA